MEVLSRPNCVQGAGHHFLCKCVIRLKGEREDQRKYKVNCNFHFDSLLLKVDRIFAVSRTDDRRTQVSTLLPALTTDFFNHGFRVDAACSPGPSRTEPNPLERNITCENSTRFATEAHGSPRADPR